MAFWEEIFLWIAVAGYAVSFLLFLNALVFRKERLQVFGFNLTVAAFAAQTVAIAVRWYVTGHIPAMYTYENSLAGTWIIILTYLVLRRFFPPARPFAVAVTPLVLLILGNGMLSGGELRPLEPAFRSNWIFVHVLFAWFSFGSYLTAFCSGGMYLLKEKSHTGFLIRLPELKLLDELSLRLILFGFFAQSVMIASGAIWAHGLWGRYWGWDPVETWSLISWLVYGANLHLRVTLGWTGRRAAWLAVLSLFAVIFLYFGFGHGSSVHTVVF
ncbi:cytochrome c biogenesis protein CcsA [Geomesophilobacter sediminis]|uniref:Cytochrome c biogenesis protein CcsA n=1 Tax=Geomesophilobacter sediminis TaxID=2798584 RepID=A0A8J7LTY8_9BACT|nr:cytochrome c biogenesis protein CcsA [Geomesophilobacter sediminis]MBJ6723115.1 cytochrome c biogenesis protein CcsA [Geomesophilobacter sediminis]